LDKVGVLIDGRWIIKSESMKLSPKLTVCRNYILSLLFQKNSVNRKEIQEKIDLPMEQVK
jgi:hypothetical protein